MAAIKLGKHVYCEKPLTHTVWEARQLAQAARERKVATQMGNQGQASEGTRRLCEYIADNAIGPVREVHVWTDRPSNGLFNEYWPQGVERPKDTPPVPKTLDWDLWLGPAPERPYNPFYAPFRWRGWWDFGTGALGDIGCHACDPVFRALKLGQPLSVQASSTRVNKETYPLASMVTYEFPARGEMPPLKLVWYDGGLRPPRPAELDDSALMGDNGHLFIGDKGKLLSDRRGYAPIPEKRQKEYGEEEDQIRRIRLLASWYGLSDHNIRIYDVLHSKSLELHLEVKESLSVEEAHRQVTEFEEALREAFPDISRIATHIEPAGDQTATRQAKPVDETRLMEMLAAFPETFGVECNPHDIILNRVSNELSLSFHCIMDGEMATDAHALTEKVEATLRAQVPNLGRVIIHVEPPEPAKL